VIKRLRSHAEYVKHARKSQPENAVARPVAVAQEASDPHGKLIERQIRVKEEFPDTPIMKDLGKVKHLVEAVRRAEGLLQLAEERASRDVRKQ